MQTYLYLVSAQRQLSETETGPFDTFIQEMDKASQASD